MALSSKKGIRIASPFKLHAKFPLDVREQVDTLAERDELVTSNAVTEGLRCWVKSENTLYVWNGKEWLEWVKTKQDKNVHFEMFGSNQVPVNVYGGDSTGQGLSVGASGTVIVGSGSTKAALEKEVGATDGGLVLASDSDIDFYVNNKTKRAGIKLSKDLNFYPMVNDTGTIGTPTNKFNHIYSTNLDITNITGENATFDHVTPSKDNFGNVGAADKRYADIYGVNFHGTKGDITTVNSTTGNITNVNSTNVKTTDTQSLAVHPETHNTGSIGTAEKWYKDIYGTNFHGTTGNITTMTSTNTTSVNNTLTNVEPPTNGTGHIGSTGKRYADVFSNNFTGTNGNITNVTSENLVADDANLDVIYPDEDNTGSVGKSDVRYTDIYGVNFHGTNGTITNMYSTDTQSATVHPVTNNTGSVGTPGSYYKDIYGTNLHSATGDITNVNSTNVKTTDTQSNTVHPATNNTGSLGTAEKYYKDVYGTNFHGTNADIDNVTIDSAEIETLTSTTGNITNVNSTNVKTTDTQSETVHPATNNTGSLGTAEKYYKDVYGTTFHGTTGNITNVNSTNVKTTDTQSTTVHPAADNSGSIGASDKRYTDIYGVNFHGTKGDITTLNSTTGNITNVNSTNVKTTDAQAVIVHPADNNTGSLGTAEKYYKDAYVTNLHSSTGSITTLTSTTGNITNVNATNVKTTDTQSSTVHPATTNTGSLGTADKYYKDTYSTNYHGTTGDITTLNSTTGNITNVNSTNVKSTNATLDNVAPSKDGAGHLGTEDSRYADIYGVDIHGTTGTFDTLTATTIDADITGDLTGNVHGNADTASKLTPGHKINTTSFDGSADIVTDIWGKARNITISDGTNSGTATSVNGGANVTLPLPATIKATFVGNITGNVTGNASTATKFAATHKINGTAFDGSEDITTTTWGASRKITITDADATNSGTATAVNGGADVSIPLPENIKATTFTGALSGNASSATKLTSSAGSTTNPVYFSDGKPVVSAIKPGTVTPKVAAATAVVGTSNLFAREDHVHPVQTTVSGNAGTATKWAAKHKISLSTDATGSVDIDGSGDVTLPVTLAASGATAGTYGNDAVTLAFGGSFNIPQVTVDIKGRVTGIVNKAIKLPATPTGVTGNAGTATQLANSRTFTVQDSAALHSGTGVSFNGTANATLKMPDRITSAYETGTYLAGNQGNALINSSAGAGKYVMLAKLNSTNGYFTQGVYNATYLLQYTAKTTVDASTNGVTKSVTLLDESGNSKFPGTVTATTFSGSLSGNASSATKVNKTLTFTGGVSTSFNGSADVSVAIPTTLKNPTSLKIQLNGGTSEGSTQFTYDGSTAKTVNITASNVGAAASSHTHSYAGSSSAGGAATSANKVNTNLIIKLNSGSTEGTNLFTFNGSTAKTVNITASSVGAAASSHTHSYAGSGSAGGAANSVANSLKIQLNGGTSEGSSQFTYNGSAAKSLNITASSVGAAASSHTHSYAGSSSAGGAATSANKVNKDLVIQLNGGTTADSNKFTFNGSAAKTINITPASIGAATSGHTHSSSAVAMPVGTIMFSTSSTATFFQSTMGGTWEVVGNIQALVGASTTLTIYMFKKTKA